MFFAPIMTLATYFICPFCQPPNRDGNQATLVEQRFKNYIDQKYHLYDDADKKFYHRLVDEKKNKEGALKTMQDFETKRYAIVEQRIKD